MLRTFKGPVCRADSIQVCSPNTPVTLAIWEMLFHIGIIAFCILTYPINHSSYDFLQQQEWLFYIAIDWIWFSVCTDVLRTLQSNPPPSTITQNHIMKVLIMCRAEFVPIVAVWISVFCAIALAWCLDLYPYPADVIVTHRMKPLHGLLYSEHDGKRGVIYDYPIKWVTPVKCHEVLEVIVL